MGEEICKFISGSPSKLSSRWFSFSWFWSRLFINGHRIDSPSLFLLFLVLYLFGFLVNSVLLSFFLCREKRRKNLSKTNQKMTKRKHSRIHFHRPTKKDTAGI